MSKRNANLMLTVDELGILRQLLGQLAPSSDGNVMKLRSKLYGPLDGTPVMLALEEVRIMRDVLGGLVPIGEDGRPVEEPRNSPRNRIAKKLSAALGE